MLRLCNELKVRDELVTWLSEIVSTMLEYAEVLSEFLPRDECFVLDQEFD